MAKRQAVKEGIDDVVNVDIPAPKHGGWIPKWMYPVGLIGLGAAALITASLVTGRPVSEMWQRVFGQQQTETYNPKKQEATTPVSEQLDVQDIRPTLPGLENILSDEEIVSILKPLFLKDRAAEGQRSLSFADDKEVYDVIREKVMPSLYFKLIRRTAEQDKININIMTDGEWKKTFPEVLDTASLFYIAVGTAHYSSTGNINVYINGDDITSAQELVLEVGYEMFNGAKDKAISAHPKIESMITSSDYFRRVLTDLSSNQELRITPAFIEVAEESQSGYINNRLDEALNYFGAFAVNAKLRELGLYDSTPSKDTEGVRQFLDRQVERYFAVETYYGTDDFLREHNFGYNSRSDAFAYVWYVAINDSEAWQELQSKGHLSSSTLMRLHDTLLEKVMVSNDSFDSVVKELITAVRTKEKFLPQIKQVHYNRLSPDGVELSTEYEIFAAIQYTFL